MCLIFLSPRLQKSDTAFVKILIDGVKGDSASVELRQPFLLSPLTNRLRFSGAIDKTRICTSLFQRNRMSRVTQAETMKSARLWPKDKISLRSIREQ
ncbi:hypothetical protein BaRGS_00019158 [Batillaria attramentaria]|uniref:Uncharacterized protein n=1 Tax=Batillaria attramentaria TaxID=370345 RepID=A0ABD0KQT4_9CAEN